MKERPILMSAPMVRALLAGTKTQTRRVVKPTASQRRYAKKLGVEPSNDVAGVAANACLVCDEWSFCPYGVPGDRLWVREAHCFLDVRKSAMSQFPLVGGEVGPDVWNLCVEYSDGTENENFSVEGDKPKQTRERGETRWRPSIHMPRWASRITLEIVAIRVERLQDISEADAAAEGIWRDDSVPFNGPWYAKQGDAQGFDDPRNAYRDLWESINGAGSWAANPFVWVLEFRRI